MNQNGNTGRPMDDDQLDALLQDAARLPTTTPGDDAAFMARLATIPSMPQKSGMPPRAFGSRSGFWKALFAPTVGAIAMLMVGFALGVISNPGTELDGEDYDVMASYFDDTDGQPWPFDDLDAGGGQS